MPGIDIKQLSWRLARIDRHLISTLALRIGRGSLSEAVAQAKRYLTGEKVYPIKVVNREEQRLALAEKWASEDGLDPNYAASVLYGAIAESCRIQAMYMNDHFKDVDINLEDQEAVWQYYRQNLLNLTELVAPVYNDHYTQDFFGSKLYDKFERGEIAKAVENLTDNSKALDLGCATGIQSIRLAKTFDQVIGYDISPAMVAQANNNPNITKFGNVSFFEHDLENGLREADDSVSFVLMNQGTASDIRNLPKLLSEINRVLKPGGKFIFSFYNTNSLMSQLGFLPWPVPLAANIDSSRHCLEVHFAGNVFLVYARPYTVREVEKALADSGLLVEEIMTHPTVSSVLPEDILSTEIFESYGDKIDETRRLIVQPKIEDNCDAKQSLAKLDESLSKSPLYLGAYIVVVGTKK